MKLYLLTLFTGLIAAFGFCETDTTHIETKVNAVTVYPEGAQITRTINLTHNLGKSILIFDDLPFDITQENLQLACNKLQHIQSLKLEKVYGSSKAKSKEIVTLEKDIKDIKLKVKRLNNTLELLKHEQKLLSNNNKLNSTSTTIPLTELKQTVEYFNRKMETIETTRFNINLEKEAFKDDIKIINTKLQALYNKRNKNNSKLVVIIDNKTIQKAEYTLSYYHKYAGWIPSYDFRVEETDLPLTADYNATVFQSTGEDWKNIKLTLATIEPVLNEPIKTLEPWVLENKNATNKIAVHTITPIPSGSGPNIKGTVTDAETGETIPMANVVIKSGQTIVQGGATDFDGMYIISPLSPGIYTVEVSYIGYSTEIISSINISTSTSTQLDIELVENEDLLGVIELSYQAPIIDPDKTGTVITRAGISSGLAGIGSGGGGGYSAPRKPKAPKSTINSIVDNILNDLKHDISYPEFTIETPFTILADSKQTNVRVKSIKIPTDYRYTIVPKIQQYAFLEAKIPDWTSYNFLSGNANIYLKGKFIGQTFLDTDEFSDTLDLQLGKDADILVQRTYVETKGGKTISGNKVKETIAYNILIKNNKTTPFQIFIEDQIPITHRKDIVIELLEQDGAKVNESKGQLTWDVFLKPGEKREINFSYLAKYPK